MAGVVLSLRAAVALLPSLLLSLLLPAAAPTLLVGLSAAALDVEPAQELRVVVGGEGADDRFLDRAGAAACQKVEQGADERQENGDQPDRPGKQAQVTAVYSSRKLDAAEVSTATVERVRQRFVEEGLEAALVRQKQQRLSREQVLDGRAEARLIALACSAPPAGRKAWTLRLLADRLVELEVVDTVCKETVRRALKKMRSSRG